MQIIYTPSGDAVATMKVAEVAVIEAALMRYLTWRLDPNLTARDLAVRMLREVTATIEQPEQHVEGGAESAAADSA
ncbi:hypothetical protein ACTPOK_29640 [Streptomyces inhibens]|uniref:hypothetical protein n=1 Tax=Streptomyces inhibens TaxID=2293571 RepID=UPI00402AE5C8